jgi:hypothetical protein
MRPRPLMAFFVVVLVAADEQAPAKLTDYTKADLKSLGIEPCPVAKDEKTGFIVGGKNETSLIAKLPSLAGRSIKSLEKDMRPGALSRLGFLGKDESLLEILAEDNRFVVETKGLSHRELAHHLHIVGALAIKNAQKDPFEFLYHGKRFKVTGQCFRGTIDSPFEDGTKTNCAANVWNVATGKTVGFSLLVPYMVERYGFYEGKGTTYRVDPRAILEVFDFIVSPKRGRVVDRRRRVALAGASGSRRNRKTLLFHPLQFLLQPLRSLPNAAAKAIDLIRQIASRVGVDGGQSRLHLRLHLVEPFV